MVTVKRLTDRDRESNVGNSRDRCCLRRAVSHARATKRRRLACGFAADSVGATAVVDELPDSDPQKEVTENFVKKFVAKYGRGPATFAGNGYDSMMMLAAAIGRAGSTDPAAIRDAFEQTTEYPGVTSVYTYSATDHYGAQPEGVALHAIKDGRMRLLEE